MAIEAWLGEGRTKALASNMLTGRAVVKYSNLGNLANEFLDVDFESVLGLESIDKFINSIMFYPFSLTRAVSPYEPPQEGWLAFPSALGSIMKGLVNFPELKDFPFLSLTDVRSQALGYQYYNGFDMGYYHVENNMTFRDYEPYRTMDIWLPYYGLINIPMTKIVGRWLCFRLYIDFYTGMGNYIIGVNDTKPNNPYSPFLPTSTGIDTNTEILASYVTQIGYKIPFGDIGASNFLRDTIIGVGQAATAIGTAIATGGVTSVTTTTSSVAKSSATFKPSKGLTKAEFSDKSTVRETVSRKPVSSTIDSSMGALNNLHSRAGFVTPNNTMLSSFASENIIVVETKASVQEYNGDFDNLFGRPYGNTVALHTLTGYAEIPNIHLEGSGFENATSEELSMLKDILASGAIFP